MAHKQLGNCLGQADLPAAALALVAVPRLEIQEKRQYSWFETTS
jgi:hypothetical protein